MTPPLRCAAPNCLAEAVAPSPWCVAHQAAPAGRKGGWLSARRRAQAMAGGGAEDSGFDASMIVERGKATKGGLWIGSRPRVDRPIVRFHMLVLCAQEFQPASEVIATSARVLHCPLPDGKLTRTELGRALAASRRVAEEMRAGGTVLSTCQAGINRSALVASLALLRLTRMSDVQVIALVRQKRDASCLFNEHFRKILASFASSPARH